MLFDAKREEASAITQFRKNCTYHGLDIHVSLKALTALKAAAEAQLNRTEVDIGERDQYTLGRRGLIRITHDGEVIITQLGLMVITLAEAGGLIVVTAKKERIKAA